jgi:hypothetical protein
VTKIAASMGSPALLVSHCFTPSTFGGRVPIALSEDNPMVIDTNSAVQNLQSILSLNGPSGTPLGGALTDTTGTAGVSVDLSKPGQLMSQLADLAQSDPTKFKAVTAEIAQKLKAAAGAATGPEAAVLNKLADRFDAASQSGKASDLAPQQAAGHHHHHGGSYNKQGIPATTDDGSSGADTIAETVQGIISGALNGSTPAS